MADIDLEAEQVVGEEEEAPRPKKGKKPNKLLLIFGGIVVVEAIVLFLVFDVIRGTDPADAEAVEEPVMSLFERYSGPGRIEIEGISIYDGSDPSPRADRRYTVSLVLWIEKEAYQELLRASEENDVAMDLVKDDIRGEVKAYLLKQGGIPLKNPENQGKIGQRMKDYLNDQLRPLRNKILKVEMYDFRPSRY